jgi:hypothetical protein
VSFQTRRSNKEQAGADKQGLEIDNGIAERCNA